MCQHYKFDSLLLSIHTSVDCLDAPMPKISIDAIDFGNNNCENQIIASKPLTALGNEAIIVSAGNNAQ